MDHRWVVILCVLLSWCLVVGVTPVVGTAGPVLADAPEHGTGSVAGDSQPVAGSLQQEDRPEEDNTVTRVELAADGSATWSLTIRTRLDTDASVSDFRQYQETFRQNTTRYLGTFERRMTGVVEEANASFPREMRATGFEANTSIQELPQRWGVVTYQFTWDGFATAEGDRLVVGDIFAGGFFIDEDELLEIAVPDSYVVDEAVPTPTQTHEGVVEWSGREDFGDGRPRVVAVPEGSGEGALFGVGPLVPALLVALVLVAAIVAVGVTTRRGPEETPIAAITRRFGSGGAVETGESGGSGGTPAGDSAGGTAAGNTESTDPATDELLTDEDRVEALLAEYGGRMKQGDVVDELGWSKSKTSRVLSAMAEDDRIRKLRIGRENLIEKPDDGSDSDDSTDARNDRQPDDTHRWET